MDTALPPAVEEFERHRPRLRGLAYRMLGSIGDAEDVVQDAWLRWHGATSAAGDSPGGEPIRIPAAWLTTAVTRLCIDRLRAGAAERDAYVGPWLPEPWMGGAASLDGDADAPDRRLQRAADLSMAFLLVLERLSPEERAAFLLHDVFEIDYAGIGETLGKSEAACRQMVSRARARLRDERPRFEVTEEARQRLLRQYVAASQAGDEAELLALFAPDATFTSDGGGKTWAARRIIRGADKIARLLIGVARKTGDRIVHVPALVNGEAGLVSYRDGKPWAVLTIETDGARILSVHRVMNPDKLTRVPAPSDPRPAA